VVHAVISLGVIAMILLHAGRGGGLSDMFGGGMGGSFQGSTVVERRLELLASSVLADVVLRSGVDFVHTLGHNEIRQAVLRRLEELVERRPLQLKQIGNVNYLLDLRI